MNASDTPVSISKLSKLLAPWRVLKRVLAFLRRHLGKSIAGAVVLLIALAVYGVTRPPKIEYITEKAVRGDLRQTVEAVGTVVSERDLALQFPTIDVVAHVYVKEGDKVKTGQKLAGLRSGSLSASVASASASVASAQAALRALEEGSRPEDIAIAQAQVDNKRASLEAAKQSLQNAETNLATSKAELEALKAEAKIGLSGQVTTAGSTVSQYLSTAKTAMLSIRGVFNANDIQDAIVKSQPAGYNTLIANLQTASDTVSSQQSKPAAIDYQTALSALREARSVIATSADVANRAYDLVSNLATSDTFTSTSRETNKTTIATQRSYLQTGLSAVDSATKSLQDESASYDSQITAKEGEISGLEGTRDKAKADIVTYETSLAIDQASLDLKKAPARQTDIDAARARVRQAQADLARAAAQYHDTILTAPVDGTITKVNVKAGEIRPSSEASITMLGDSPFRVEMFVSEVDVPKVQVGQTGAVVLDAFPGKSFALRANEIDTAATDKDGVPKYRVKLDFVFPHDELKVGMTGDAEVTTGFKADVVNVPLRSVIEKDGKDIVRVQQENGDIEEREVTTGMEGEGGTIEVTGVEEGETVIVLEKK